MPNARLSRRGVVLALAAVALVPAGCSRKADRCAYCGMKLDAASPWAADLVRGDGGHVHFDTPRCALMAWRTGRVPADGISLQEFYDRTWRAGPELRFAIGSDVMGPMGTEVVPIDPARAEKFATDHHAARTVGLAELTLPLLESLS